MNKFSKNLRKNITLALNYILKKFTMVVDFDFNFPTFWIELKHGFRRAATGITRSARCSSVRIEASEMLVKKY